MLVRSADNTEKPYTHIYVALSITFFLVGYYIYIYAITCSIINVYLLQLPCGSAFISPLPRWSQISTPHKPVLWGPKSTARFYSDLRTSGGSSTHIAVLFYNLDNLGNPDLITSIQHGKHNNNNHRANSSSHRYPSIYIYSREKSFAV